MNNKPLIFSAVENNALLCFHYLLSKGADITCRNRKGWSIFHVSVQAKNPKFVLALVNLGVDINEADDIGITLYFFF